MNFTLLTRDRCLFGANDLFRNLPIGVIANHKWKLSWRWSNRPEKVSERELCITRRSRNEGLEYIGQCNLIDGCIERFKASARRDRLNGSVKDRSVLVNKHSDESRNGDDRQSLNRLRTALGTRRQLTCLSESTQPSRIYTNRNYTDTRKLSMEFPFPKGRGTSAQAFLAVSLTESL